MSHLCRLKSYKGIGKDGQWAYNEITQLREQLKAKDTETDRVKAQWYGQYQRDTEKLQQQLLASDLTIKKMREALELAKKYECGCNLAVEEALTLAPDTSGIEQLMKDAARYKWVMDNLRVGKFNGCANDSNGFQDYSDAEIDKAMGGGE